MDRLDALVHCAVLSAVTTTPPGDPAVGDRYLVPAGAGGAWAGQMNNIAVLRTAGWVFYPPKTGWVVLDLSNNRPLRYTGAAWSGVFSFLDLNIGGVLSLSRETISAAGSTQAQATEVSAHIVHVTTVAPGTGVRLRDQDAEIYNGDTADLRVWPPDGGRIGTQGINVAGTIYAGGSAVFRRMELGTFIAR